MRKIEGAVHQIRRAGKGSGENPTPPKEGGMGHPTGALITFVIMPFMKTKLRMIGSGFGVLLPKKVIDNLRLSVGDELELVEQEWGIELSQFDPEFANQVEAFRRTEAQHRNSYRKLG